MASNRARDYIEKAKIVANAITKLDFSNANFNESLNELTIICAQLRVYSEYEMGMVDTIRCIHNKSHVDTPLWAILFINKRNDIADRLRIGKRIRINGTADKGLNFNRSFDDSRQYNKKPRGGRRHGLNRVNPISPTEEAELLNAIKENNTQKSAVKIREATTPTNDIVYVESVNEKNAKAQEKSINDFDVSEIGDWADLADD